MEDRDCGKRMSVKSQIFCEMSADDAAQATDAALENLPADGEIPAYEIWRQRIQNRFHNQFSSKSELQEVR